MKRTNKFNMRMKENDQDYNKLKMNNMNVNKTEPKCFIIYLQRFIPHCALAFQVFIEKS